MPRFTNGRNICIVIIFYLGFDVICFETNLIKNSIVNEAIRQFYFFFFNERNFKHLKHK